MSDFNLFCFHWDENIYRVYICPFTVSAFVHFWVINKKIYFTHSAFSYKEIIVLSLISALYPVRALP